LQLGHRFSETQALFCFHAPTIHQPLAAFKKNRKLFMF
jgi:hypothetical protein